MVVLDEFFQITELKPSNISPLWKVAHITAFIVAAVCGFATAFTFGRILDSFGYNCILNANIEFHNGTYLNSSMSHWTKPVRAMDLSLTLWGPLSDCNFAQFTPLVMMISAVVWGTYFAVMSRGGAGYPTDLLSRPYTILYPCILFTTIFLIVYIVSTYALQHGILHFCDQFKPEFNNTGCVADIDIYSHQFKENQLTNVLYHFYPNMETALISSQIGISAWVFQLVLCLVRVVFAADFDLHLVTVIAKETDEEILEKIVELSSELSRELEVEEEL